jgi:phosphatidylglycerophosphate synthase
MNKTQKGAWSTLMGGLLGVFIYVGLYLRLFVIKKMPTPFGAIWVIAGFFLLTGLTLYMTQKKQSPAEVESDERDKDIQKNAVLVAFICVWLLLFIFSFASGIIIGVDGSIPVWLIALVNVGILNIILMIYAIAVLVQYKWETKRHE